MSEKSKSNKFIFPPIFRCQLKFCDVVKLEYSRGWISDNKPDILGLIEFLFVLIVLREHGGRVRKVRVGGNQRDAV
jgi:hypothetical protein